MVNKFKDINWSPDITERRKFARTLILGSPCILVGLSIIIRLSTGHWNFKTPALVAGVVLTAAVISWLIPAIALPVYRFWFFIVCIIDSIVTTVVLTVLFYVVLFPAGLLYRVFKPAAFRKKPDTARASYWEDVQAIQDPARYYRQY